MAQKSRVRVGAVSFLNAKPLIYALLDNVQFPGSEEIELILDVPSRLADRLNAGNLDIGLIPIIEYFHGCIQSNVTAYRIIPHISISSRGAVRSIQLFSHVPIPAIRRIALDTSSRTSRILVRIWLAEKYHLYPEFTACSPSTPPQSVDADAVLLIGDAALKHLGSTNYALDLGAEWQALTSLPFIYACWVAREGIDPRNVPETLQRAKETGISQSSDIARIEAQKLGFSEKLCHDYLTKHIFYDLGPSEIDGMMKFYELAVKYELAKPGMILRFMEGHQKI